MYKGSKMPSNKRGIDSRANRSSKTDNHIVWIAIYVTNHRSVFLYNVTMRKIFWGENRAVIKQKKHLTFKWS